MKPILLLTLCVLMASVAMAQEKFLSGYIKTADGTRTYGYIDYRNWENNPKEISFKLDEKGKAQVFNALDIAEFGVKDEVYVGAVVEKEVTANLAFGMNKNPDPELRLDTVFLQAYVSGEKSLLGMKSSGKQNYYIKEDDNYILLIYKWYQTEQNGKAMKAENRTYRRQLATYLGDCRAMTKSIESSSYSSKSLENIFLTYYACKNDIPTYVQVREKVATEIGVLAGASSTILTFENSRAVQDIMNYNFASTTGVSLGVSLNIILPRNNRKWSFYNELMYSSYLAEGGFREVSDENDFRVVEGSLGYGYLKLNNMVRFSYPLGGIRLFVNGGMSNGLALSEINQNSTFTKFYSSESTKQGKVLSETRTYEQGYLLGAGATAGRLSGELRYERGNGMSVFPLLNSRVERFSVLVTFRLK
jgi:hypothetical protein